MTQPSSFIDHWTWVMPIVAWAAFITVLLTGWGGAFLVVVAAACLAGAVFAAVHHAEVVAHRIGEPYGTLVLAVAVTVIEVALIVSLMLVVGDAKAALARDTVFAAIMIVCNGIVGAVPAAGRPAASRAGLPPAKARARRSRCWRRCRCWRSCCRTMRRRSRARCGHPRSSRSPASRRSCCTARSSSSRRSVIATIFSPWARGDDAACAPALRSDVDERCIASRVSLVAVVGLAKIAVARDRGGGPRLRARRRAVVGIVIAALVLLPEGLAAARAAHADKLQTSLNLALGFRAREHRLDDSRDRRDVRSSPGGRWSSGSARWTRSCCS